MKPSVQAMLDNSKLTLDELIDYVQIQYNYGVPLYKLAKYLGTSVSSLQRFCKFYNIKINSREEQLVKLHKITKGRKWTNKDACKNVSEGVKKSYKNDPNLSKLRAEVNTKRWNEWDEDKRTQVVSNGLIAMRKNLKNKYSK